MKRSLLSLAAGCSIIFWIVGHHAVCAPDSPTVPPGPLLKAAPSYAEWTVTVTEKRAAQSNPDTSPAGASISKPPKEQFTTTKTGDIRKVLHVMAPDLQNEKWLLEGYAVTLHKNTNTQEVSLGVPNAADSPLVDFPELNWISAKNFVGEQKVMGKNCLVFKGVTTSDPEMPSSNATATIDAETRLPLALVLDEETRIFQFAPPPQAKLVPPPAVLKTIKAWKAHLLDISKPPPRPY